MSTGLEVITPGLMTSVQDRGRFGFQALGISVSGALDPDGFDLANALAGNEAGTGALEIRMLGPTLEVTAESGIGRNRRGHRSDVAGKGNDFRLSQRDLSEGTGVQDRCHR